MDWFIRRSSDAAPNLRSPYVYCSGLRHLSLGSASPASATAQGLNANSGTGGSNPSASVRHGSTTVTAVGSDSIPRWTQAINVTASYFLCTHKESTKERRRRASRRPLARARPAGQAPLFAPLRGAPSPPARPPLGASHSASRKAGQNGDGKERRAAPMWRRSTCMCSYCLAPVRHRSNDFLLTVAAVDKASRALPPQHVIPFHAAVQPNPATPQGGRGSRSGNRAEQPVAAAEAWHAPGSRRDGCRSQQFWKTP